MRRDVYDLIRHLTPDSFQKWISRYNFEGGEIQSFDQEQIPPIFHQEIDLSVARDESDPLILAVPGRAFVFHGFTQGSSTRDAAVGAYIKVRIQRNAPEYIFHAKHNRGFRGDFTYLYLSWPAQASTSADFYVLKFDDDPWQQDSQFGASFVGGATEATLAALSAKIANDYGASAGAVRAASQIGNTTGQADFNKGAAGAQTLRQVEATQSGTVTQAALTVGTTAVRLTVSGAAPSATRKKLVFQPDKNSTQRFYYGSSTVTNSGANRGVEALPGVPIVFDMDASDWYIIADAASQTVYVTESA